MDGVGDIKLAHAFQVEISKLRYLFSIQNITSIMSFSMEH